MSHHIPLINTQPLPQQNLLPNTGASIPQKTSYQQPPPHQPQINPSQPPHTSQVNLQSQQIPMQTQGNLVAQYQYSHNPHLIIYHLTITNAIK